MKKTRTKLLALVMMGASLTLTASAAFADGDAQPNVTMYPAPVVLQTAPANEGAVAGSGQEPYNGPYLQLRLQNMGQ